MGNQEDTSKPLPKDYDKPRITETSTLIQKIFKKVPTPTYREVAEEVSEISGKRCTIGYVRLIRCDFLPDLVVPRPTTARYANLREEALLLFEKDISDAKISKVVGICEATSRKWRIHMGFGKYYDRFNNRYKNVNKTSGAKRKLKTKADIIRRELLRDKTPTIDQIIDAANCSRSYVMQIRHSEFPKVLFPCEKEAERPGIAHLEPVKDNKPLLNGSSMSVSYDTKGGKGIYISLPDGLRPNRVVIEFKD